MSDHAFDFEADHELARRSASACFAHLADLVLLMTLTSLGSDHPALAACLVTSIAIASLARYGISRAQAAFYPERRALWRALFETCVLLTAAGWGGLTIAARMFYGFADETSCIVLLCATGIAAGGATSLAPHRGLAQRFCLSILTIPWLYLVARHERADVALIILIAIFLFFLLVQIRRHSAEYDLLLRSRNQLQTALDAMPGYVWWLDRELRYKGASKKVADDFQVPLAELSGKPLSYVDAGPELRLAVESFATSAASESVVELRLRHAAGDPRWHLLVMRREEVVAGKPDSAELYVVAIDIDNLKRVEQELQEQRNRTANSARLASLGEMAGGIAHEVNSPLAIIDCEAQELRLAVKKGTAAPEAVLSACTKITKTVRRIAKIIKGLRTFAREAGHDPMEVSSLHGIVEETLSFCRKRFANHSITLEVAPMHGDTRLPCRRVQISQVLLNLLNNAFDAVEKAPRPRVRIEVEDRGREIALKVIDNGPGVPPACREKIFDPFFTTKAVGQGTGLGLSVSRGIIESHGGRLYLDAAAPETTFVAVLPKTEAEVLLPQRAAA